MLALPSIAVGTTEPGHERYEPVSQVPLLLGIASEVGLKLGAIIYTDKCLWVICGLIH